MVASSRSDCSFLLLAGSLEILKVRLLWHRVPSSSLSLAPVSRLSSSRQVCLTCSTSRAPADPISYRGLSGHPSLQRFLPTLATGPSRVESSSLPFPIFRCRGSEDFSCLMWRAHTLRCERPPRPGGCVLLSLRYSRFARVAPLLVVSPLRGDHPGLAPCFQRAPLLGFYRELELLPTCVFQGPGPRALFRVSKIQEACPKSSSSPPWGLGQREHRLPAEA